MSLLLALLNRRCRRPGTPAFAVTDWNRQTVTCGEGEPLFHLHIRKRLPWWTLFRPSLAFGEAYTRGDVEIDGELGAILALSDSFNRPWNGLDLSLPNNLRRARQNVIRHYDLGNDFYKIWLDRRLIYSCAYFKSCRDSLDLAQEQKLNHICRKLLLEPGLTLVDVGCGWGGLVIHAAKHYGVKAYGITLSKPQVEEAQRRIQRENLKTAEVDNMDFRLLASSGKTFDRFVSVGMFEHVGRWQYKEFMSCTRRLLKPGALGLLQTIGNFRKTSFDPWLNRYIFPGAAIPALDEIARHMGREDLDILDVENLRRHYLETLNRWAANLAAHRTGIIKISGEQLYRMWWFYLNVCAGSFKYGKNQLFQILFSNGPHRDLPLTREYQYADFQGSGTYS